MSDVDCTPGREPRSVAASVDYILSCYRISTFMVNHNRDIKPVRTLRVSGHLCILRSSELRRSPPEGQTPPVPTDHAAVQTRRQAGLLARCPIAPPRG